MAAESTINKYRVRPTKPPSQTWRTFLDDHVKDSVAVDFFTVPTATLQIFFTFVVLRHDRRQVVIAPCSPWQNPCAKRLIVSIRRQCLDHLIVIDERHLHRILRDYFEYYHESCTHLLLDRNAPVKREVEPLLRGRVVAIPQVGGLNHRYLRAACSSFLPSRYRRCRLDRSALVAIIPYFGAQSSTQTQLVS